MTKKFMLMMRFLTMRVFLLTERNTERIAEHITERITEHLLITKMTLFRLVFRHKEHITERITERITEHLQPLSPCAPRPPSRLRIR